MATSSALLSIVVSVAAASFWPTARGGTGRIASRLAMRGIFAALIVAPVAWLAWLGAGRSDSEAFQVWDYLPFLLVFPLTTGWMAGRLAWNPAKAGSRGLIFGIAFYLLVGAIVSPIIGLSLGDDLVDIVDNQPLTCVLVVMWPVYTIWGLGLFGLGPH